MSGAERTTITLIGSGAAGKSTVDDWPLLFVDFGSSLRDSSGNISAYINRYGYDAYVRENVETCALLRDKGGRQYVAALSSGFMT